MPTLYGKNGRMRIYDSSSAQNLSQSAPKEVHVSNVVSAAHTDITANMLSVASGTATILAAATDFVYVGNKFPFSVISVVLGTPASANGGALKVEYWNGTTWVTVGSTLRDGTAGGGSNTLQVSGSISWDVPSNWVANDIPATGTNLYYVRLSTTSTTTTAAVAQALYPSSGQYYEVVFHQMNLTAPEGNNRPEEIIRMNRGKLDAAAHYIQGLDDPIIQPPPTLTFSAWLDSVYNKTALAQVLACQNPNIPTWNKVGVSTKTDTQLPDGLTGTLVNTPPFTDPTKKTICIQAMWDDLNGDRCFREFNEVHVPSGNVSLTESPDQVVLALTGGIYGSIKSDLVNFGYRY